MKRRGRRISFTAAALPALLLCALALPRLSPAAGFGSDSAGTSSGQFLKIAAGARGAGLGEAYSALADDAFALDWNPAGLINIKKNSMAVMHAPYLAGTFADYFAYAETAGDMGSWGLGVKYMNYGRMNRTDSSGLVLGNFTPYDVALSVGFACYITGFNKAPEERFVLGATGKFVKSRILSEDNTVSADIGLNLPYMFDNKFRVSMTVQNIMGSLRYDKEQASLPLILRLGTVTRFSEYFNLTGDIAASRDNLPYLAMGGEIVLPVHADMDTFLRAGFNTRAISDVAGARNVGFGGGLRYKSYQFDYAFSPFGDLGSVHRLSLLTTF
ncbi:MAG: PorV/PorQ family protein [Elusimicrobia bacterium]|nr:PorV/PorQ family protein [Elusimicrobiota bacterium]